MCDSEGFQHEESEGAQEEEVKNHGHHDTAGLRGEGRYENGGKLKG